jgi:hypothetical protein
MGLIIPAKAKWQVDGEKSTNYFCNLEKHYQQYLMSEQDKCIHHSN